MGMTFVNKPFHRKPQKHVWQQCAVKVEEPVLTESTEGEETAKNKKKNTKNMTTMEKVAAAEAVVGNLEPNVKILKKDKGLIERTESSKIILTEDNREILTD